MDDAHFYVPTESAECWRERLRGREKHWRPGRSAQSLATCWEKARGFPPEFTSAFQVSGISVLENMQLVVGFPEYKTRIPPVHSFPSQTDLMVLARSRSKLVAIAVEGKVTEDFDDLVADWKKSNTRGRVIRLNFLADRLGLDETRLDGIRYQLLHRTASALLAAERFAAGHAIMAVHSFCPQQTGFDEYSAFLRLFGLQAREGIVQPAATRNGVQLYFAWISSSPKGAPSKKSAADQKLRRE